MVLYCTILEATAKALFTLCRYPEEEIRCVFDDNCKMIFVKSSYKPMLWVLIIMPCRGDFKEHPQHL